MGILRKGMSRRRLKSEGTPAAAEILDIRYTNTRDTHGAIFAVKLAVRPPAGPPFEVDGKINASMTAPPEPGEVIPIRYDPDHPSSLIYDEEEGERQHREAVEARRAAAFESPAAGQPRAAPGVSEMTLGGVEIVNASGADKATTLDKLARLREQGLLTDEQLEAAKRQLDGSE